MEQYPEFKKLDAQSLREYINLNSAWIVKLEDELEETRAQVVILGDMVLNLNDRLNLEARRSVLPEHLK
jgi:hypothetical protein